MGSSSSKSFSLKNTPGKASGSTKDQKAQTPDKPKMIETEDFIENVVCHESDLKENEMKAFELGTGKVLVVRQGGKFTAVGNKCTHYGAPLHTGALGQGRVRCPWHGACFNINTGDIEDFPGLDSLPCYQVTISGDGNVKVKARKTDLESNRVTKSPPRDCGRGPSTYVVVGGGPSAASCVEQLRQNDPSSKIIMVCKENALPYDRVKISKMLDATSEKLQLRNDEFYKNNQITVKKGVEAVKVDTSEKKVVLSNGECLSYTSLYLATGSKSRRLLLPGNELKNVFTLRSIEDGGEIYSVIDQNKDVVILGVSFIGMEAAAYCVGKVKSITIIGRDDVPFKPVFGQAVGAGLMKLFIDKGVQFKMQNNIKRCVGNDGVLNSLELEDGSTIPADILIMGVGSTLATEFLKDSDIQMEQNGAVKVNDHLQTNIPEVFAGGDIAYAPVYAHNNKYASIGHFGLAEYHGRIAALNMVGKATPLKSVPFFWTLLFGKSVRYCGYGKFNDILIDGDAESLKFLAYYFDESGRVTAMASCQRDPVVAQFAELLAQGKSLYRNDLTPDPLAWTKTYLN